MIAILGWSDGFVKYICVKAIYPTFEQAKQHAQKEDRWIEFDFGTVDFDWNNAHEFTE